MASAGLPLQIDDNFRDKKDSKTPKKINIIHHETVTVTKFTKERPNFINLYGGYQIAANN